MGKSLLRCILASVVAGFLCLGACSDDGATSSIDLNGRFSWNVTIAQTTCGGPVGQKRGADLTITQDGADVTVFIPMTGEANVPLSGRLDGRGLQVSGTYADPPWSLVLDVRAEVGGGGDSLEGTMVFSWRNSETQETCAESGPFSATRI